MVEAHDRLRVVRRGPVAVVTVDAPPRNALDDALRRQLIDTYETLGVDRAVRAIVLHGADGTFSAGGDLFEDRDAVAGEIDPSELFSSAIQLMAAIEGCPTPTVAALQGPAYGAGLEMACACDLRVSASDARFCASGVNVGLIAGQFRLPRLIGLGRAKEMLLTGEVYDAVWAREVGLVNEVVDDPVVRAVELADRIASRAADAVRTAKLLAQASHTKTLDELNAEHLAATLRLFATLDHAEAVRAFVDRERPRFIGS